mgnify:CR=1 FL=1
MVDMRDNLAGACKDEVDADLFAAACQDITFVIDFFVTDSVFIAKIYPNTSFQTDVYRTCSFRFFR